MRVKTRDSYRKKKSEGGVFLLVPISIDTNFTSHEGMWGLSKRVSSPSAADPFAIRKVMGG